MNRYTAILLVILFVFCAILIRINNTLSSDREKYIQDRTSLLENISFFRTKDSLSAAEVYRLTLDRNEFERKCANLTDLCEDLKIKIKRLKSATSTITKSTYAISAKAVDSIRIIDSVRLVLDTIRCYEYSDSYISFLACNLTDTLNVNIEVCDTIDQLVYKVPRKFLFFKYGCKGIRQSVVSQNPYTKIIYTEYIELK